MIISVSAIYGCGAAWAEESPFAIESGHWMSFDHYKDADKRGILPPKPTVPEPAPVAEETLAPTAPGESAAPPQIAAPARPLDPPLMPGLNKGYTVKVTSTEDDTTPSPAPVINAAAPADIHLADKNWQLPQAAVRYQTNANGDEEEAAPLAVRMTFLPNAKVTPEPTPDYTSAQHAARQTLAQGVVKPKQAEKTAPELAACAAIDAYKKQQLDAIQSDRQTLKSLQDAIASLGLQKQLGFMTGTDSALNASGRSTPMNIDIPAQTNIR
jgi:hypothetical protein